MKVSFLVENIEKHISLLSKILPSHTQIPVFSNILIEASNEGLFLSSTDLELGVRIKIPAKIEEEGATTIPGKQFIEVINTLPKDKITLVLEKDILTLISRGNKITFQTISNEEFPNLFEKKGEKATIFTKEELKEIFSKLIFAVSFDETRPVLTGILLYQKNQFIDFVATDGYRLSIKKIQKNILKEEEKMILSAKLINEVLALKPEKNEIAMYIFKEGNQILFESEDVVLIGRLIEGDFPNYEKVIPSSSKTRIVLDKEEFMQSIRLSSVFARDSANIIKIKIEEKILEIFSRSTGVGEGEIKIDIEQEGDNNEISFNVKFISDFLKNIEDKKINIEMNSSLESAIFKVENDKNFLHVIMPVRVQE